MNESRLAQITRAAREMSAARTLDETLLAALAAALLIVPSAESVAVTLVRRKGGVRTALATDDVARDADRLQSGLHEGPGLQSLAADEPVRADDLQADQRWPSWSDRVVSHLGLRSALACPLSASGGVQGALSLYSTAAGAFDAADEDAAAALAAQVGLALLSGARERQFEKALAHRTVIGQAQGMLMQRFDLEPLEAFAVLKRVSQAENRRLRQIAIEVVTQGIDATGIEL